MKALVTGASGFVGTYLADDLHKAGHDVIVTAPAPFPTQHKFFQCDLTDPLAFTHLLRTVEPDAVFHLAGAARVGSTWQDRDSLLDLNIEMNLHLARALFNSKKPVSIMFASSSLVYAMPQKERVPIHENSELGPTSPYGISKLAAEMVLRTVESDRLKIYVARSLNHVGPGQGPGFVCADFARRILEAPMGGTIHVGNLQVGRDFTDVRDIVRAYRLMIEKQPEQRVFAIGSGKLRSIEEVLQQMIAISGRDVRAVQDPALLRSADPAVLFVDPSCAKNILGWTPQIPFDQTVRDIMAEMAVRIRTTPV